MSDNQRFHLERLLMQIDRAMGQPEFHHGGAIGADTQADTIANLDGYAITVHPCPGVCADEVFGDNGRGRFNGHTVNWRNVMPPLVRNRNIVRDVQLLIAAPETDVEQQRSGTWATVRAARRKGIPVVMLSRGAS